MTLPRRLGRPSVGRPADDARTSAVRRRPPFATDTEEIVAGWAKNLPYSDVRQLAHAVDAGDPITVEYVATLGNRTVRTLSSLLLDPPYLEAWCHLRNTERVFTLSRIHGVMGFAPD